jgi:short-subunit dehydrogenase
MRMRGRGGIILTSSLSGFQGNPMLAHYAATKAYNLVLAEALWDECRSSGVDVLAVCPGATLTPGYLATRAAPPRFGFPPEMSADTVVEEALRALGRQPHIIPGWGNRVAAFIMQRLLPRRRAIEMMGRVGRRLQRRPGERQGAMPPR